MDQIKRQVGDVWKDGRTWMVQFPKGKMSFKTKKTAMLWKEELIKDSKIEKEFREQYQVICHPPKNSTLSEHLVLNKNGGRYYGSIETASAAIEKHKKDKLKSFTSYNGIGVEVEMDSDYVKQLKAETYSIQKRYITDWEDTEYKEI